MTDFIKIVDNKEEFQQVIADLERQNVIEIERIVPVNEYTVLECNCWSDAEKFGEEE